MACAVGCEQSPQSWPCLGISLRLGIATTSLASATFWLPEWALAPGSSASFDSETALEMGDLRRAVASTVRLIGILKVFDSK